MAITPFALGLIKPVLGRNVLSLGYPDLLMSPEDASDIVGRRLVKSTPHGGSHKLSFQLADTEEVFAALGATLNCVDRMPSRGVERVVDLNLPHDFGSFDLVIDAGTIEHCANVGQALMNAANAVKCGGHVFHMPPVSMVNHGFYNICPTLLADFYEQNGWVVRHLSGYHHRLPYRAVEVDARKRFSIDDGCGIYFMAQRMTDGAMDWPVQSKYLRAA